MKIAILGSGIIGIASAWWLRQAGHDVVVIDRENGPAQGASRANGGQISVSYSEPWANPQAPMKLARWLLRDDAPILFRPRLDVRQWWWGVMFLRECLPSRLAPNIRALVRLSEYSRGTLQDMRRDLGIQYHHLERGILNFYRDQAEFESSQEMAEVMRNYGVDRRIIGVDEILQLEPALAPVRDSIVGGDYTAEDETGDAYLFTCALADKAREQGVEFRYATRLSRLLSFGGRIQGAEIIGPDGQYETLHADAYVAALGADTPEFVSPLGVPCNVYPTKGYSATFDIVDAEAAPTVSLTDSAHKVVYTRLGNQLRMAGTAEISGYSRALNTIRCDNMRQLARELFPSALDFDNVRYWSGLRPTTSFQRPFDR